MKYLYRVVSMPNPLPSGCYETSLMSLKAAKEMSEALYTIGDGKVAAMVVIEEVES